MWGPVLRTQVMLQLAVTKTSPTLPASVPVSSSVRFAPAVSAAPAFDGESKEDGMDVGVATVSSSSGGSSGGGGEGSIAAGAGGVTMGEISAAQTVSAGGGGVENILQRRFMATEALAFLRTCAPDVRRRLLETFLLFLEDPDNVPKSYFHGSFLVGLFRHSRTCTF